MKHSKRQTIWIGVTPPSGDTEFHQLEQADFSLIQRVCACVAGLPITKRLRDLIANGFPFSVESGRVRLELGTTIQLLPNDGSMVWMEYDKP
jgi:hypothetical protein|tara:strand:+ start:37 stop:312 length:276 start_codon:yes stop_codon:yes gene_type:complete